MNQIIKFWIDDVRPAPSGYTHIKSVDEFLLNFYKAIADNIKIDLISFDHDAGDFFYKGGDYIKCLDIIEEYSRTSEEAKQIVNQINFNIHSMNPVGRANMERIIRKNGWRYI